MKRRFYCVAVMLLCAGCAHTSTLEWEKAYPDQVSSEGNPVLWNLTATNRGMYLFNFIPLWTGHPTHPNRHEYEIGQDMLSRPQMRRMMDIHLKKWGADKVEDVQVSSSSSGAFSLWIVWRKTMRATGVAVKVMPEDKKSLMQKE